MIIQEIKKTFQRYKPVRVAFFTLVAATVILFPLILFFNCYNLLLALLFFFFVSLFLSPFFFFFFFSNIIYVFYTFTPITRLTWQKRPLVNYCWACANLAITTRAPYTQTKRSTLLRMIYMPGLTSNSQIRLCPKNKKKIFFKSFEPLYSSPYALFLLLHTISAVHYLASNNGLRCCTSDVADGRFFPEIVFIVT